MIKKFKSGNILSWIKKNPMLLLSGFLLLFIPLYPKIPLFSPIEQYIVRVRLEDFFVLGVVLAWVFQVIKQKIKSKKLPPSLNTAASKGIFAYLAIGFLSVLSAIFITRTVTLEPLHLGKTILHYLRYIEYFSLFFIFFTAIKSKKDLKIVLSLLTGIIVLAAIYGYGQRNYYWPVYSTMSREFSKGIRLYLTEHARVQSTFAGHYDLGAYLALVLPIILSLAFYVKNKLIKTWLHFSHWAGLWLLVESAARSSFAGYLVGVTFVIFLIALQKVGLRKKISYFFGRYVFIIILIATTMFYFGEDMYERLNQVLQGYPEINATYHQLNKERKEFFNFERTGIDLAFLPKAEKPEGAISTDEAVQIIVSSDTRPTPIRPVDVYEDIPDIIFVATTSATGETEYLEIEAPRTFSDNALKYGLSFAIRLDALWPQAIAGFWRNPALGSGYATLNRDGYDTFMVADGTDNNFLRTLGETGALGFATFYGVILLALAAAIKAIKNNKDELLVVFAIGYIGGTIGLLVNALYIDVFAASKVAFSFWAITGILIKYSYLVENKKLKKS
jgi:hypothetical protein